MYIVIYHCEISAHSASPRWDIV